jgi:outer membrane protein assembly factor BamA
MKIVPFLLDFFLHSFRPPTSLRARVSVIRISILLLSTAILSFTSADSVPPQKISAIRIYGNTTTRSETIRMMLYLKTGMAFDSILAQKSQRRLMATNLFSSVNIFPHISDDSLFLYVMVKEVWYLSIDDISGEWNTRKYGRNSVWWMLRLGVAYANFLGRMETLRARFSIWESRSLSLSWSKPLLPSPLFFGIGAGISDGPDRSIPWRRKAISGGLTLGTSLWEGSRIYCSFSPAYRLMSYRGIELPASIAGDSVLTHQWALVHKEYVDKSLRDELADTVFREAIVSGGWSTDHRATSFDTRSGWCWGLSASSNYPLPYDRDYRYVQIDADAKAYHRGIWASNTVAYWLRTTLRSADAGTFRQLFAGGDGSIRGFGNDNLPMLFSANNRLVLSIEYRVPLWTTPGWDVPILSDYIPGFKDFHYRFDAAILADWGHLWYHYASPLETVSNPYYNAAEPDTMKAMRIPSVIPHYDDGAGLGVGLRVLFPTFRRSVCFDFAVGQRKDWVTMGVDYSWGAYLYLDMYY